VLDQAFAELTADPGARRRHYRQLVRSYFDHVTDVYRESWGESFHFAIFQGSEPLGEAILATERRIADEGEFRPGMLLLDVGCGVGGPALNIAEHCRARVTGLNLVERQVVIARERARARGLADGLRFVVGDGMTMPFPDGAFDGLYMFDAGCHMPDKAHFYRECARVLRPGAVFIGLDWMQRDSLDPAGVDRWIEPICRFHGVPGLVTPAGLREHLAAAGFAVDALEDAGRYGDILRNWELLDEKTIAGVRDLPPDAIPPVLRWVTEGGIALAEAARAGAFLIGYWRARKPCAGSSAYGLANA
jgi:ubiquinone/menaquinone biosynthesis C-methylase UbiE